MDYYAMSLAKEYIKYCIIALPWRLYQYNILPRRILVVVNVFQLAMDKLLLELEQVIVYTNKIIVPKNGILELHLKDVAEVLKKLRCKGMQFNSNICLRRARNWLFWFHNNPGGLKP